MPDNIAPVAQEPTKIPPPIQGSQGAGALAEGAVKSDTLPVDPYEFDLDVKGQKQKMKFSGKQQLEAMLQKAMYADQVIKEGSQAKRFTAELINKLKNGKLAEVKEIFDDPAIGRNFKELALEEIREAMADEKKYEGWTPEQMKLAERARLADKYEAEAQQRDLSAKQQAEQHKREENKQRISGQIIEAMKKFPHIPQTPETANEMMLMMSAAYQRFGKHLTPDQAMEVIEKRYWSNLSSLVEKLPPEELLKRFPKKSLDKLQEFKLGLLKDKVDPSKKKTEGDGSMKKKKHLTEKEFEKHFSSNMGLAGL